jgi:3-hydroxyisobutyryl-CoA hydrolase
VKSLYLNKVSDKPDMQQIYSFFRDEYTTDYALATMKPILVALMDGIVMGGGVGVSINAPIRIATETSMFAMPGIITLLHLQRPN